MAALKNYFATEYRLGKPNNRFEKTNEVGEQLLHTAIAKR
jgi:hypothetical protein